MPDDAVKSHSRRDWALVGWIALALALSALWGVWQFLQSATPRRLVIASGVADGIPHELALRYAEILARDGVAVEERLTAGAGSVKGAARPDAQADEHGPCRRLATPV